MKEERADTRAREPAWPQFVRQMLWASLGVLIFGGFLGWFPHKQIIAFVVLALYAAAMMLLVEMRLGMTVWGKAASAAAWLCYWAAPTVATYYGIRAEFAHGLHHFAMRWAEAAIVVMPVMLGFIFWENHGRAHQAYEPVSEKDAAEMFPRCEVRAGDFERHGEKVFRVNSDGLRINLDRWRLDERTGEFHRLFNKTKTYELTTTSSFRRRLVGYHNESRTSALVFCAVIYVVFAAYMYYSFKWQFRHDLYYLWFVMFGWTPIVWCAHKIARWSSVNEAALVGPEPLTRKAADFGASKAEAPADHAAADDLAYNPNA